MHASRAAASAIALLSATVSAGLAPIGRAVATRSALSARTTRDPHTEACRAAAWSNTLWPWQAAPWAAFTALQSAPHVCMHAGRSASGGSRSSASSAPSTAASAAVAALDEAAVHAARAEAEAHGWALSRECDAGTDAHLQVYTRVVRERPGEAGRAAADSCEYEIRLVAEAPHGAAEVFALFAEADLLPSWNPLAAEGGFLDLQTRGGADGVLSAKALCRLRMPPLPSLLLHYSVVVEDRFADAAEGCLYARAASEHADTGAALPAWARKVRKLPFGGAECRFTPLPPRNEGGARTRLPPDRAPAEPGATPRGHSRDVLAVAAADDGRTLLTGGGDARVLVWDLRTNGVVKCLGGHRKRVTSLALRRDAPAAEAYSGSSDRCVRVWNVAQRGFVETLFGHQEGITALDAVGEQSLVSAAEDRTLRLWKVDEETQLVFGGGSSPLDAVAMLSPTSFVAGAQDGTLSLWSSMRKRPLATLPTAHGLGGALTGGAPCWITALAAPPHSDVVLSGSCDGALRFWHADDAGRSLSPIHSVPLTGFVNGIALARSGKFVAAAVGQEHRLGRWFRLPEARNSLAIVPLDECMHAAPKLLEQLAQNGKRPMPAPWEADEVYGGGGGSSGEEDGGD
mmetsp:Transcript_41402/g.134748  ORF Transcript_41402/g.134748 Transcript_41402/m.134748 type:complete len:628 (+) Transcript_41402:695-2578(+)